MALFRVSDVAPAERQCVDPAANHDPSARQLHPLLLRESEQSVLPAARLNRRILATSSADRSIKLWNMNTFDNISKLIGHEVGVRGWSDG